MTITTHPEPHRGLDLLGKAAIALFVFQLGALATMLVKGGLDAIPSAYFILVMCTGLFIGAQRRLTQDRANRETANVLFWSRAAVLAIFAVPSVAIAFRDYLDPSAGSYILQAVLSAMWAAITLKGAAAGKFKPGGRLGLCVAWTRQSRLAWDKAHRVLGRILFWGGLAGLATSFALPFLTSMAAWCAVVALAAAGSLFEAWRAWRADPQRGA
jgi:uncharacterized membrane protein